MEKTEFYKKYKFSSATLMIQQYLELKYKHQDKILLFRLGDFYEIFYTDADLLHKEIHLTLTQRNGIPMCGIPSVSLNVYLKKMIKLNFKIAICEQIETPEQAKKAGRKIVKRDISQIITAGTTILDDIHNENQPNYVGCIIKKRNTYILSYANILTNKVYNTFINNIEDIKKLNIIELIVSDKQSQEYIEYKSILTIRPHSFFAKSRCTREVKSFYSEQILKQINADFYITLGMIITYLKTNYNNNIPSLSVPILINNNEYLQLNHITIKNLEIFKPKTGLIHKINFTQTKMGNRLLFQFLYYPLKNLKQINSRLYLVDFFLCNPSIYNSTIEYLKYIYDIEKFITLASLKRISLEHIIQLQKSLLYFTNIQNIFYKHFGVDENEKIKQILYNGNSHNDIIQIINENVIIIDDKPNIKHKKIDLLNEKIKNLYLAQQNLLNKYIKLTKIENLKFSHNNILGYFIETTNKNNQKIQNINNIFIYKQSTLNHVRYTTKEYEELMQEIDLYKIQLNNLEKEIFQEFTSKILKYSEEIKIISEKIAHIDVLSSFATLAKQYKWSKPTITNDNRLEIVKGYNPLINNEKIITNDCSLSNNDPLWIITGPNMGGKSTFLRQNAIIILISHIGCFVPAQNATIGITDNIFTRIGANDELSAGNSTFMVEMNEISYILSHATNKSFIIIDEVGRGTSHIDGIPLASAITDYIYENIRCRSIIATHYHSLPITSNSHYQMKIINDKKNIIFTYNLTPGQAKDSFGINVAKLAGLPKVVIEKSEMIKANYINNDYKNSDTPPNNIKDDNKDLLYKNLYNTIKDIDINNLSPIELMNQMQSIKNKFFKKNNYV